MYIRQFFIFSWLFLASLQGSLPLYYWHANKFTNFGDYLSLKIVERMVEAPVKETPSNRSKKQKTLLAVGSILLFAKDGDVIWGTGMNAKRMDLKYYQFSNLDVRAVRGPKTAQFLLENFGIKSPVIYGDPALLLPFLFPEFKRSERPAIPVLIIPHYSEEKMFPKEIYTNVIYPSDPWDEVIEKILQSEFVVSSSLHGLVVAEAFGIPARYLRVTNNEPLFKYEDYYLGTGRSDFKYATSIEEAILLGGEPPVVCDLKALYNAFPFEFCLKAGGMICGKNYNFIFFNRVSGPFFNAATL